jgi:hypothetical protein
VEGEHAAEVNQKMTISIEFPADLPDVPSAPFALMARVARCAPSDESPTLFNLGFEFINLTPEQTRVIDAIIQRYAFGREMAG